MNLELILASGSATRRAMLKAAGIAVQVDRPDIDESALKRDCAAKGLDVTQTAETLAFAKADQVRTRHPGKIVIGADQMLECGGEWFDKPVDRAGAASQIARLAGRTHYLVSAIAAMRDGALLWRATSTAAMTMRPLTADFIDAYLDGVGNLAFGSVGGYQIEGPGIQLFSDIQGDHFTILGLPLLPLLGFLRRIEMMPT